MGHLSGWDRQGSVLVGLPSSRTFQYAPGVIRVAPVWDALGKNCGLPFGWLRTGPGFLKIPFSLILDVLFEVGSILNDF